MTREEQPPGAAELEDLWAGEFGDAYVERNAAPVAARAAFWSKLAERYPSPRILEVGCAHGENLRHLASTTDPHQIWGLDINDAALDATRAAVPGANAIWGAARDLPFRDGWFDLVFTVGLLIHQPDITLPIVMNEIVRCSRRWVMSGEYHAEEKTDIGYRGKPGILFKRDYKRLYSEMFPELRLREELELTTERDGFDRVTFLVFEKG